MSATFTIEGLPELIKQLQQLPQDLKDEATDIVLRTGERAKAAVYAAYPEPDVDARGRESLRTGLKLESYWTGQYGAAVKLRSTAFHAYIYENGSAVRHTRSGANRGRSRAMHVMIPIVIRHRIGMYEELAHMVETYGADVSYNRAAA
jgi:hypothetical protein